MDSLRVEEQEMDELSNTDIQAAWERGGMIPGQDTSLFRSSTDMTQATIRRDCRNSKEKLAWRIENGMPVYCGPRPSTAYATIIRRRRR